MVYVELKSSNGDSWLEALQQVSNYADFDQDTTAVIVMVARQNKASFFIFDGENYSSFAKLGINNLAPIMVTSQGIQPLPKVNNLAPQLIAYDPFCGDSRDEFAIHTLLTWISNLKESPNLILEQDNQKCKVNICFDGTVNSNKNSVLGHIRINTFKQEVNIDSLGKIKKFTIYR